jgi:hypothetical protein
MSRDLDRSLKDVMQVLGIACLVALAAVIVHKGFVDISALAQQYSGGEFWTRLARYLLANLGG